MKISIIFLFLGIPSWLICLVDNIKVIYKLYTIYDCSYFVCCRLTSNIQNAWWLIPKSNNPFGFRRYGLFYISDFIFMFKMWPLASPADGTRYPVWVSYASLFSDCNAAEIYRTEPQGMKNLRFRTNRDTTKIKSKSLNGQQF